MGLRDKNDSATIEHAPSRAEKQAAKIEAREAKVEQLKREMQAKADDKAAKSGKAPKLPWGALGDLQRGTISTTKGRTHLEYRIKDHHAGRQSVELDPTKVTARIETADEASKHMKPGRISGGVIAGGILLGPLGAAIGGGIGAAARKEYSDKYLTIEADDGQVYSILLKGRTDYMVAETFRKAIGDVQRHAAREQTRA